MCLRASEPRASLTGPFKPERPARRRAGGVGRRRLGEDGEVEPVALVLLGRLAGHLVDEAGEDLQPLAEVGRLAPRPVDRRADDHLPGGLVGLRPGCRLRLSRRFRLLQVLVEPDFQGLALVFFKLRFIDRDRVVLESFNKTVELGVRRVVNVVPKRKPRGPAHICVLSDEVPELCPAHRIGGVAQDCNALVDQILGKCLSVRAGYCSPGHCQRQHAKACNQYAAPYPAE